MAGRILVVDDDKLTRWSLSKVLTREGYLVLEARTGAEASKVSERGSPDLVLLDLRLPDVVGYDALEAIVEINPALPIVLMSSRLTAETVSEALRRGARRCIQKPIEPSVLVALVRPELEATGGSRCP
jgi:DNA-binding NtrC family response regulator